MHLFKIIFSAVFLALNVACNLINPDEEIPAYIKINAPVLLTEADTAGTASQKITDAWVYVNQNLLGVQELPGALPVLANGETEILLSAGIMNNGISVKRKDYPHYESFDTVVVFSPTDTTIISPVFEYKTNVVFAFIEDFEDDVDFSRLSGAEDIERITTPSLVFEGNAAGVLLLDSEDTLVEIVSDPFVVENAENLYFELNYKNTYPFEIGIRGDGGNISKVVVTAKDYWNKIYIDVADEAAFLGKEVQIYLKFKKPASIASATYYFDNIKALY